MVYGAELCTPLLIAGKTELLSPEARPVLAASRCGRLGVAVSHCRPSTSPRLPPFKSVPTETGGGVLWKGLGDWSFLNGDCKKKFLSRTGEDGESGRLVTCCGELNEKFVNSFLLPSSEGVPLLLGVSGVSRAGSLVRLVLRSPSVIAPGVTWRETNDLNKHYVKQKSTANAMDCPALQTTQSMSRSLLPELKSIIFGIFGILVIIMVTVLWMTWSNGFKDVMAGGQAFISLNKCKRYFWKLTKASAVAQLY